MSRGHDKAVKARPDETAWLIEETWSGFVLFLHRDFDAERWRVEASSLRLQPYEWIRTGRTGLVLTQRKATIPFLTKDAAEAMRFPTREAAEQWLRSKPPWISKMDQYQAREHMWPAPDPATSTPSDGAPTRQGKEAPDALPHSPLDRDGLVERLRFFANRRDVSQLEARAATELAFLIESQARAALSASGGKSDQRRSSRAVEAGPDGPTEGQSPAGAVAEAIAEQLQGQCILSLEDVLAAEGLEDTAALRGRLDELVFECSQCGWWCEAGEEAADQPGLCDECAEGVA